MAATKNTGNSGSKKVDTNRLKSTNEKFLRGRKHQLKTVSRKKPSAHSHKPRLQSSRVSACVELDEKIEQRKMDKNAIMHEVAQLKQQQLTTGERIRKLERRLDLMNALLAKELQNPGFIDKLVQCYNRNRQITGGTPLRNDTTVKELLMHILNMEKHC